MKLNVEIIKNMNPCKSRFDDNFLVHYPKYDSNFEQFLSLDRIAYEDKIWVARRLLNKNQLVHFAVLCAQSVLSIYENKYPDDNRIKDCVEYLMTITDFSNLSNKQREKLIELREGTYQARRFAYAADAADAAAYAADAADADDAKKEMQIKILNYGIKLLKSEVK